MNHHEHAPPRLERGKERGRVSESERERKRGREEGRKGGTRGGRGRERVWTFTRAEQMKFA